MDDKDESLPKIEILTKNYQFKRVYNRGESMANDLVVLYVLEKEESQRKIGFSVSKKIGKAVVRNRIKRIFKEVYRKNKSKLISNIDLVLIARKKIKGASFLKIKKAVMNIFKRANIIK